MSRVEKYSGELSGDFFPSRRINRARAITPRGWRRREWWGSDGEGLALADSAKALIILGVWDSGHVRSTHGLQSLPLTGKKKGPKKIKIYIY